GRAVPRSIGGRGARTDPLGAAAARARGPAPLSVDRRVRCLWPWHYARTGRAGDPAALRGARAGRPASARQRGAVFERAALDAMAGGGEGRAARALECRA